MKVSLFLLVLCGLAHAETITLAATKDSDVYSFLNRTVGDTQTLNVNSSTGMAHSNHSVIQFNVAASTIPASEVASATLRIYSMEIQAGGEGGTFRPGTIAVHRQGKAWGESIMKWTDLDPREKAGTAAVTQQDAWVEVDVTTLVIAWMNGTPNHGFLLRPDLEGADSGMNVQFFSREFILAANRPQLQIVRGTPSVTAPPVVTLRREDGRMVIEWPVSGGSGWILQETADLAAPFVASTATPAQVDGMWRVVHTPGAEGKRFFRLTRP